MTLRSPGRRAVLQGGLAAGALFLPGTHAWVWAQSEGATRLLRAPKLALVIGNSAYRNLELLLNPGNDARAVGAALGEAGFAVTTVLDAPREQMVEAIRAYVESVAARKSVGLFYFAGHGVQLAWRNYLLPVDAAISKTHDIPAQCVDVADLIGGIERAANPMNVIILDACRENPFGGVGVDQKGLSQMDAPPGTLLAYATAPGNLAADGNLGSNGLYTGNLLREMRVREAKIEDVFKRVRLGVRLASKGAQIPWESTSLEEDFYFNPPEQLRKLSQQEEEKAFNQERARFEKARDSQDLAQLEEYLRIYPSGRFVEFAQLLLDRALAAGGEKRVEIAPSPGNPNTLGSARADTLFKVGDQFVYQMFDVRLGKEAVIQRQTVTAVSDLEVVFNNGRAILDPLGNLIQSPDGRRYTPRQEIPLEYGVGKRWSTRFDVSGDGGTAEFDFRIVARETVTVPAGRFDCFRIEGRGVNSHIFRPPVDISLTFWRAPAQVRRHILVEEKKWHRQQVNFWERRELLSYRQS